jgi:hypothetical protein
LEECGGENGTIVLTSFSLPPFGVTAQLLQDDHRLPEGMKRIGYDANTSRYIFRDRFGSLWQGSEVSEYGEMIRGLEHLFHDSYGMSFKLLDSYNWPFGY